MRAEYITSSTPSTRRPLRQHHNENANNSFRFRRILRGPKFLTFPATIHELICHRGCQPRLSYCRRTRCLYALRLKSNWSEEECAGAWQRALCYFRGAERSRTLQALSAIEGAIKRWLIDSESYAPASDLLTSISGTATAISRIPCELQSGQESRTQRPSKA